ncbi:MAG: large subunit ribosomal protein [Miltoncostaeaceae bacterium]|jgi:large subunit ribosomal protein L3|nr:large subunit ribosomal protein [Miltoncostaeaceae bacterium]
MPAIIGRKAGMTQIFSEDGQRVPLTVIEAGPCPVTQVKTVATDGYDAVQLGFGVAKPKNLTSPERGHLKKAGAPPLRHLREFSLEDLGDAALAVGDVVTVEAFEPGQMVRVTGTSKGKGYAGTIKRHNFSRGPVTHGSHNVRGPGSIGAAAYPARVFKGLRMSGRMGGKQITQEGLRIVDRDPERNLLLIRGAVPGAVGGIVIVRPE